MAKLKRNDDVPLSGEEMQRLRGREPAPATRAGLWIGSFISVTSCR